MRRLVVLLGAVMVVWLSGPVSAGLVDSDLSMILDQTPPDATVSSLVYLVDQVDLDALTDQMDAQHATLRRRHEVVILALQNLADTTQRPLVTQLEAMTRDGSVQHYQTFWIRNIIRVDATPAAIRQIAARPDADIVYPDYHAQLIQPADAGPVTPGGSRSIEIGLEACNVPQVWAMGFTGQGMLVANLDTGVDGSHPALAGRWAGVADPRYAGHPEWAWLDALGHSPNFPRDNSGHGTHTMGTICGGAPGDQIGVAPGALWIASNSIAQDLGNAFVSDTIAAFQWMADPDGDPSTNWDVPHTCSHSWGLTAGMGYPDCDQTFWSYLDACEAAGVVLVFCAGNEGSHGLRRPADRATSDYNACAVAAVDANDPAWPVAGFSSRGPTYCTPNGSAAVKPDIAAPGVNVRSAVPGGGYQCASGTSSATPHVGGIVALIRQANPNLSVEQVKQVIYDTARDLGPSGEDNSYGWGMIDAQAAVRLALDMGTLGFAFPDGRPELVDPNGGTTIRVVVNAQTASPVPGTGALYYSNGGDYTRLRMTQISPNVYDAVFPRFACGDMITYYFSVETDEGGIINDPYSAPNSTYRARAYTGAITVFADDFETHQGWSVDSGAHLGNWQRADPQEVATGGWTPIVTQPEDDHSPDGTLCYVTGPLAGSEPTDYDVDEGPTHLTSPTLELAGTEALVSYWRWFHISAQWDDQLIVSVSNDDGGSWVTVEIVDNRMSWYYVEWNLSDYVTPTDQVRVRFTANDTPNNSLVEALIDDFSVEAFYCDEPPFQLGDVNCDGLRDAFDIDPFILALIDPVAYASQHPHCDLMQADANGDGAVNTFDIDPFVELLTGPQAFPER